MPVLELRKRFAPHHNVQVTVFVLLSGASNDFTTFIYAAALDIEVLIEENLNLKKPMKNPQVYADTIRGQPRTVSVPK